MIILSRWRNEDCTLGRMTVDGFHCFTLELPWRDNQKNISCIPVGTYEYFIRRSPSKNMDVLQLKNVGDREYIQIHAGNYTSQIQGCILVGDGIKYLNKDSIPDVTNSLNTLKNVLIHAGDSGKIKIVG